MKLPRKHAAIPAVLVQRKHVVLHLVIRHVRIKQLPAVHIVGHRRRLITSGNFCDQKHLLVVVLVRRLHDDKIARSEGRAGTVRLIFEPCLELFPRNVHIHSDVGRIVPIHRMHAVHDPKVPRVLVVLRLGHGAASRGRPLLSSGRLSSILAPNVRNKAGKCPVIGRRVVFPILHICCSCRGCRVGAKCDICSYLIIVVRLCIIRQLKTAPYAVAVVVEAVKRLPQAVGKARCAGARGDDDGQLDFLLREIRGICEGVITESYSAQA